MLDWLKTILGDAYTEGLDKRSLLKSARTLLRNPILTLRMKLKSSLKQASKTAIRSLRLCRKATATLQR